MDRIRFQVQGKTIMEDRNMDKDDYVALRQAAKENHRARVSKNQFRLDYACKLMEQYNITYRVCNVSTGHIQAYDTKSEVQQFWAGTGTILNSSKRGIDSFVKICLGRLPL